MKVQFSWVREAIGDETSSCWLRVSSSWAGERYGGVAIPRVGMEVLVDFLEGDPDRPLVSGCLYHGVNVPPYELPAHKTRSVFKTLSSPGGKGFNELRIEDKKDQEQIFVHAQRNWDQNIGHDQKIHVGHERHDTVVGNSYSTFQAEEHRTTVGDRKTEIKAEDHLTVGNSQHVKIGNAQLVEVGREIHIKAGEKVVIEAGLELTVKAGGSFIKLDPGGVTVVGSQILLNAGGTPGSGSGLRIKAPLLAGAVDSANAGYVIENSAQVQDRYDEQVRVVSCTGVSLKSVHVAVYQAGSTAPRILTTDQNGLLPKIDTESAEKAAFHFDWDSIVVPIDIESYEGSRSK